MFISTKHFLAMFLGSAAIANAKELHTQTGKQESENPFIPRRLGYGRPRNLKAGKGTPAPRETKK